MGSSHMVRRNLQGADRASNPMLRGLCRPLSETARVTTFTLLSKEPIQTLSSKSVRLKICYE